MFAGNADKLAPMGSSQQNEALNNVILSKLPKTKFYGGSESNDFRVAAAVLQKNTGKSYVSSICTSAGLSPGKHAKEHAHTQSVAAKRQLNFKSTKTSKRRRNELCLNSEALSEPVQLLQLTCKLRENAGLSFLSGAVIESTIHKTCSKFWITQPLITLSNLMWCLGTIPIGGFPKNLR